MLGIPVVVRNIHRGFDWRPECMMRATRDLTSAKSSKSRAGLSLVYLDFSYHNPSCPCDCAWQALSWTCEPGYAIMSSIMITFACPWIAFGTGPKRTVSHFLLKQTRPLEAVLLLECDGHRAAFLEDEAA